MRKLLIAALLSLSVMTAAMTPAFAATFRNIYVTNACGADMRLWVNYATGNNSFKAEGYWDFTPGESNWLSDARNNLLLHRDDHSLYAFAIFANNKVFRGNLSKTVNGETIPFGEVSTHVDDGFFGMGDVNFTLSC